MKSFSPLLRSRQLHPSPASLHSTLPILYPFGLLPYKVFGRVLRYRCTACGKSFSRQTFRLDYYAKNILSYKDIIQRLSSCESLSVIERAVGASPDTISNRISRAPDKPLAYTPISAHLSIPMKRSSPTALKASVAPSTSRIPSPS